MENGSRSPDVERGVHLLRKVAWNLLYLDTGEYFNGSVDQRTAEDLLTAYVLGSSPAMVNATVVSELNDILRRRLNSLRGSSGDQIRLLVSSLVRTAVFAAQKEAWYRRDEVKRAEYEESCLCYLSRSLWIVLRLYDLHYGDSEMLAALAPLLAFFVQRRNVPEYAAEFEGKTERAPCGGAVVEVEFPSQVIEAGEKAIKEGSYFVERPQEADGQKE